MEENKNIEDPKYVKNVYNALKSKVDGFNKTEQEFNESLKDEAYVMNVHNALSKKINGFNKTSDEFKTLMMPLKKKDGTKTPSTSTTKTPNTGSVPTNGSLDSSGKYEYVPEIDPISGKEVYKLDANGQLVRSQEKVLKGYGTKREEQLLKVDQLEKKASKPIINNALIKKHKEQTTIPQQEVEAEKASINSEMNNEGAWNKTKTAFRWMGDVVGNKIAPLLGKEINPNEGKAFIDEEKQAIDILKKELKVNDVSQINPKLIVDKTKEIVLSKRLEGIEINKNNEFLSTLSEEEKNALELDKVNNWTTLQDKDRFLAVKSNMKASEYVQIAKYAKVTDMVIKEAEKQGKELSPEFLQYADELIKKHDESVNELNILESEIINNTENIGSTEDEIDFLGRNYDTFDKVINSAKLGFGDLYMNLGPKQEMFMGDLLGTLDEDRRQEIIDQSIDWETAKNKSRSKFKRDVEFENLSKSNYGQFFAQELGTQLPIFAQIALPGGITSIGMTSTFDKYSQMEQESNSETFISNGKQISGFRKEDGTLVDAEGNIYKDENVTIVPTIKMQPSKANMFMTSFAFGSAEALLGALPTKNIFSRSLKNMTIGGERTIFREGIKTFAKKKLAAVGDDVGTEVVSEGATQVIQNIADIMSGKKDISVMDNVGHAAVSAGMLSFFMSSMPAVAGIVVNKFSDNKSSKQVRANLNEIFSLQEALNDSEISDTSKKLISDRIKTLEKSNVDIVKKNIKRIESLPSEVIDGIIQTDKKQEILVIQAQEIKDDPKLSDDVKKTLLADLESEFSTLEKKRADLVSDNVTVLDSMSDSESLKYKNKAAKELLANAKSKGLTDTQINFTEEQINKKAIEIYNNSKINLNAKKGDELYTNEIKTKVDDVQENAVTKEEQSTQSQTEIKETEQEVLGQSNNNQINEVNENAVVEENLEVIPDSNQIKNESTPTENTPTDGNVGIGVEPLGEVAEAGKQEGAVDNQEGIQPTVESKPTEGKVQAVKISVGKYDYTFENGTWTAKDKDGNVKEKNKSTYINNKGKKVKRKEKYIPNKVYEEFAKTINFTEGEKVIDDPYVNGEEYVYEVAKRSKNPAEIAGEIAYAETQDFNEGKKHPLHLVMAKVLGTKSVNRQSFIDASDINNINQSIGLQYFTPKEKGKGKGIDQIAQYVEIEFYGDYNANEPRVTEEDIVKFILDNPGGTEKFLNENKNEILDSLKTAFTDVTGLPANQKFLEQAIDQQIEKQERIAGQDILFAYNQEQLIELSKELDEFKKQENGTETTTNKSDEKTRNPKNIAESQPKSESEEVSGKQVEKQKRRTDQINDILNDLDKRLEDFGRNNLGINIAGVVARGAIKAMKLANNGVATLEDVVKAGIDYIKSTDWYQNLDESKQDMINENTLLDILDNTIKENEKSKKVITDLRQKIKDNKSNAKQIVEDIKNFLANNSIDGVLTPAQADALIRKSNDILVATDTLKAFDKFIEYYEKVKTKAENKLNDKAKIKAKYEQQKKQVLDLKAQGKSLADIISILNQSRVKELSEKETQIVEMIFKTADVAKMTDAEIKTYVDEMFAESRKIVSDSNKPWKRVKESFKGLRVKFLDSQATAKKILNKSNLSLVTDRMIALKGASAKAEIVFEQAKTKIYSKLNTEQRQKLDEIISLRRIIAIDKNRAERGLTPLLHSKYVNGEMSQRKLETMEQDMGKEEFDNLNERADFYFDEFRNILNEMEENGLISKQTRDQLFEVDYQPRKFLHHLMNGSEEISENAKAWQKSTYGLSGDQVLKLDQGSVEAMVLNSEWLLATAVSMRQKSMFMNKLNTKLATEFNKKSTEIEALRQKPNKTKAEIKQIKEFKNLSETFIPNPIIGVTKSGNPKYKYNTVKPGYRNAYYYVNGVQQKIMMKEEIYEQWFGEKKFINNPKAIEKLAKWSGSRLLKTMATGRNPLFFITNTPRDFVNTLIVSPEYSKFKLLAAGQLIKDLLKSFVAIKNKNDSFEKYFEYGGGMSFLSSEGMLTGKSLTREILENSKNKTVKTILDANIKDKAGKVLDWVTLHELNQYSELIFRIAIFDRTVKNELGKINETDIKSLSKEQQEDIYFRAVASARSVMDFNQGGYITKDMESVMPYLNAATQGSRVLMDAFVERPIETTSNILQLTAMGVTGAMGMSIALSGLGKDDDDERTSTQIYLENLEMVSPYDRRNFFIIFTGRKDEDGNPEYLKFAKAQQITPFTQIAEHHTENYFRKQYGLKEKDNLLEKSLSAVNDNISPIQFMSFKDDPSLVGISLMARNPFGRAAMTYATGYDFYRQEKLSWDIDNKDVPKYMEGYTSDRVDDFYKELGQDLKISPIRTKSFVESIVTSPGTNPYLGIIYAGLDATMSEDQTKNRLEVLKENTLKNIGKRAIGFGKPYNVTLEEKEKLKEQIEEIQAENIIFNKKVDDIAKGFINKTESRKVLVDRLKKELKLEPFKAERAVKRLEDKIKFSDVDQFYLDLKYENNNEVKALMIFNKFGDISKLSPEKRKEAGKQLEDISFTFNDETANKYRELLIEFEER